MNIAIGKLGRSLFFDKEYRKTGKGDLAPMATFLTLAKSHPNDNFYFISPTDLYKSAKTKELKELNEVPDNFIDLTPDVKSYFKDKKAKHKEEAIIKVIKDKNIKFDFGIIFQGPDFATSTHNCLKQNGEPKKLLDAIENYCSPVIGTINEFKFPWILVNEDPRYVPVSTKDIINDEICILSHLNKSIDKPRYKGYGELSKEDRDYVQNFIYAGIERTSLLFLKKYDFRNYNDFIVDGKHYKKDGFIFMACNESPNRFDNVKNWILDKYDNVKIYGNWKEDTIKNYKDRFESKPMAYLQDELWRSKYTYVPGFFNNLTNFVTIKFWEMCIYGILPFFDKNKYDTDNLLPIPDFLRCESPEDMKNKIDILEKDPKLYEKYLNEIYSIIDDKYFNGDFINQIFAPIWNKNINEITINDFIDNSKNITN